MNSKLCKKCLHDDGLYGDYCMVCNCYDRWEPKILSIASLLIGAGCGIFLSLIIYLVGK